MGAIRAAGWLVGHVLLYLVLCLVGWLAAAALLRGNSAGLGGVAGYLWLFVIFYGFPFGLPTLLVLVALCCVGRCVPARRFRQTALVALPLIAVVLPLELPPSTQYGAQLVIQVPIQVAFALLLRPPPADSGASDDELLAAWGLTKPIGKPPRERWDDAEAQPAAGAATGPTRSWYAVLLGVLLWLVLLVAGGHPLLLEWIPLGPERAVAHPIAGPGDAVNFVADPDRQYLIYQNRERPVEEGETCRFGGTYGDRQGSWAWSRPPGRVTVDGKVYRYRGVVSGVDGRFEMSCNTGTLLVADTSLNRPSPAGPAAVAVLSLPVLGIVYVAWARRHARLQRRDEDGETPTTETEAAG